MTLKINQLKEGQQVWYCPFPLFINEPDWWIDCVVLAKGILRQKVLVDCLTYRVWVKCDRLRLEKPVEVPEE